MTVPQNTKMIPLTQGKFALVDSDDFDRVSAHKWFARRNGRNFYASRKKTINGKKKSIDMHVMILGAFDGMEIDHINGDGLDNRKENLRVCTHSQNICNCRKAANKTSLYKGVRKIKSGKWCAHIKYNGKMIHLGTHNTQELAAQKYNTLAILLWGTYAKINNISVR